MLRIVVRIPNAVIGESRLPNGEIQIEFFFYTIRESALDELQCFFQGNVRSGGNEQMEVIGHNNKFVQEKSSLSAVVLENVYQQSRHAVGLEKATPLVGHGCDEECSDFLGSSLHIQ